MASAEGTLPSEVGRIWRGAERLRNWLLETRQRSGDRQAGLEQPGRANSTKGMKQSQLCREICLLCGITFAFREWKRWLDWFLKGMNAVTNVNFV